MTSALDSFLDLVKATGYSQPAPTIEDGALVDYDDFDDPEDSEGLPSLVGGDSFLGTLASGRGPQLHNPLADIPSTVTAFFSTKRMQGGRPPHRPPPPKNTFEVLKAENGELETRHVDPFCQAEKSIRDLHMLRQLVEILPGLARVKVDGPLEDVVSAQPLSVMEAAAEKARFTRTFESGDVRLVDTARSMALAPHQAAEYLRRVSSLPRRQGYFPPTLVEDEESLAGAANQHKGWLRDKLNLARARGLVFVFEFSLQGETSSDLTLAPDESVVVLDPLSFASYNHLHTIRSVAKRRWGGRFAHPHSGKLLSNISFDKTRPRLIEAASSGASVLHGAIRRAVPSDCSHPPLNRKGILPSYRRVAAELSSHLRKLAPHESVTRAVTVDQPLRDRGGRAVTVRLTARAGSEAACLGTVKPAERELVTATTPYAAFQDVCGSLAPKQGACTFAFLPSWASERSEVNSVAWSIDLLVDGEIIPYKEFAISGDRLSRDSLKLASTLKVGGAVALMASTRFTSNEDGTFGAIISPSAKTPPVRVKVVSTSLSEVETWVMAKLDELPCRPRSPNAVALVQHAVGPVLLGLGIDAEQLCKLWKMRPGKASDERSKLQEEAEKKAVEMGDRYRPSGRVRDPSPDFVRRKRSKNRTIIG